MALERKDRVKDQSSTTGTGTLTIDAVAPTGYRTIASAYTTGATLRYTIMNAAMTEWEVGQGVWTAAGSTLTRVTVYASTNAGALVNFSAGVKIVFTGPVANDLPPDGNITLGTKFISNSGTDAGLSFDASNNATFSANLVVSGAGPHAIGGAVNVAIGMNFPSTLSANPGAGSAGYGLLIQPTIVEAGSGNHGELVGVFIGPTFTNGVATASKAVALNLAGFIAPAGTTDAATLRIAAAPTGASNNYALWIDDGAVQFDSTLDVTGAITGSSTIKAATGAAVGGATPGTGGLAFPATAVAVVDANTLDDYVEGTWTPIDSSGASLTFTDPAGSYEKVGRQFRAGFYLVYPVTADGSTALIGGLPFTVSNNNYARQGFVAITDLGTLEHLWPNPNATTVSPRTAASATFTNVALSTVTVSGTVLTHI